MMKRFAVFSLISILFVPGAWAGSISTPSGLAFDPPESLDVTYQTIPAYDEKEKLVAGWDGEKLQYFVTIGKLPPEYSNPETYLVAFSRDMKKIWKGVDIGRQVTYKTHGNLAVTTVELSQPTQSDGKPPVTEFISVVTNGKLSYFAVTKVVHPASVDDVFNRNVSLFQTARIESESETKKAYEGDELEGSWIANETAPDGRPVITKMELKAGNFAASIALINQQLIFVGTGVWYKSGSTIHWTYVNTKPEMHADQREDDDDIVSYDGATLVLKSHLSGKEHTFLRDKPTL